MKIFKLLPLLFSSIICFGQLKPIGSWTDHMPFQRGSSIATDGKVIYAGTTTGLFTYNTEDNSVNKFTKVNLLNDVDISQLKYSKEYNTLIIVYANANIDLIVNNRVINIPFIKLSNEKKEVNEIKLVGRFAYLSTGFGITVIDIDKREIADSYKFGPNGSELNVNSSAILNNSIYAATNSGLYSANINSNLLDFNSWTQLSFKSNAIFRKLFIVNDGLAVVSKDSNANGDSLFVYDGSSFNLNDLFSGSTFRSFTSSESEQLVYNTQTRTYIIDSTFNVLSEITRTNTRTVGGIIINNERLFLINTNGPLSELSYQNGDAIGTIRPNGPAQENIFDIDIEDGVLWGVRGGHDLTYNNSFKNTILYKYEDERWTSFTTSNSTLKGTFDALSVSINPENSKQVFFGTWARGLIEYRNSTSFKLYQDTNSSLHIREALLSERWIGVGETAFDEDGNLWVTNTYQVNGLSVRKKNGSWKSFNLSHLYSEDETALYDIVVDNNGYKWIALPKANSIIVFDDNNTIDNENDDRYVFLTPETGQGSIPGSRGIKIEKDKDGLIWIGTSDGIAVHFNPGGVFDGDKDFDRIIFFDGENNEIVLKNSTVKEIAIDGFNRKWIGTENSGVLLLSADGKQTLLEFNEDNSPLFSNSINAISIDDKTGEVFIATAKGLLSYRSDAIDGSESFSSVSIFPNPVRENYSGSIAISGLLNNSTVKITDINGTLINELKSEGGQVLWNGNNFDGRRASTGVYLVFLSGEDSEGDLKTEIGKILFVK